MDRIPKSGEFYRHFKNKMYQVLTVAIHSETMERMVVYQALYGDFSVYVRPLPMFMEEVDRQKYPDVLQKYRFELTIPGAERFVAESPGSEGIFASEGRAVSDGFLGGDERSVHPLLLQFLDADSYGEKCIILKSMKGQLGQTEVDSLYLSLDVGTQPGTVEEQLSYLAQHLEMQQRFDASRLRRS